MVVMYILFNRECTMIICLYIRIFTKYFLIGYFQLEKHDVADR